MVDTNVAIVANGRRLSPNEMIPSIDCKIKAIDFLQNVLSKGVIYLDLAGDIQKEYRRYLSPRGQPGVGDQFYLRILNSMVGKVERLTLPKRTDGELTSLPQSLIDAGFDPSDRKFAALAIVAQAKVANATDSDWIHHAHALRAAGVNVTNLCGCDAGLWFERASNDIELRNNRRGRRS